MIQAKLAADALESFLDLVEREGRIRSQQEDAELRKAAGSILMLTEGLIGRKATSRDEATSAVATVIDERVIAGGGCGRPSRQRLRAPVLRNRKASRWQESPLIEESVA